MLLALEVSVSRRKDIHVTCIYIVYNVFCCSRRNAESVMSAASSQEPCCDGAVVLVYIYGKRSGTQERRNEGRPAMLLSNNREKSAGRAHLREPCACLHATTGHEPSESESPAGAMLRVEQLMSLRTEHYAGLVCRLMRCGWRW